ncbi:MAG: CPBP family intramembrane metalloprotease [Bacilli bacterium]|jgi:membrane protease YdiL (CAAX protease family)|nr:CPBP family intramembrane metalloprotease [Bacilli bacterium]
MSRIKALINIIIYLVVQLFSGLLIYNLFGSSTSKSSLIDSLTSLYFVGFTAVLTLILIIITNFNYLKSKILYSIDHYKEAIKYGVLGFLAYWAFSIVFNIIRVFIEGMNSNGTSQNQEVINEMANHAPVIIVFSLIVLIIPFLEELIFRMSLMGVFVKDKKSNRLYFYIIAALLFGLAHDFSFITNFSISNLFIFLQYFIVSLVIIYVYYKSNHNILATYVLHFCNNLIAFIAMVSL